MPFPFGSIGASYTRRVYPPLLSPTALSSPTASRLRRASSPRRPRRDKLLRSRIIFSVTGRLVPPFSPTGLLSPFSPRATGETPPTQARRHARARPINLPFQIRNDRIRPMPWTLGTEYDRHVIGRATVVPISVGLGRAGPKLARPSQSLAVLLIGAVFLSHAVFLQNIPCP